MREPVDAMDQTAPAIGSASGGDPGVTQNSQLRPGTRIDHYEVVDKLGTGGMGVVFRARDTRLGREVAIKLLRGIAEPGTARCQSLCSMLFREAQSMAQISHPNLVTVFDVGEFGGCLYVAMEYVDGQTLREWAFEAGRTWRERLDALLAAGRGLAEAHSIGITHRDFKPDNVLVSRRGRVQVSDFGLARGAADFADAAATACVSCTSTGAGDAIDVPGAIVGTPGYMSPEQHEGRSADARSDQFSFAVSAWELLHEVPPFPGRTVDQIREAVLSESLVPPPRSSPVPRRVTSVLERALRPDPSARYPSMTELLGQLEQAARSRTFWRSGGA